MGCLLCRSPIPIDLLLNPSPVVASGETGTSTLDLSRSKRVRREDASGDLSCSEEDRRSPRLEIAESEGRTEELVRLEVAASIVSSPAAAAKVVPKRAREAISTEIAVPSPAIEEAVAGEVTVTDASSDPPSQEDAREVVVKATEDTPVRVEVPKPSEPVAQTSCSPEPPPGARAVGSAFGTGVGAAAGPLLFGLASNSGKAPQGSLTTRAVRSERGKASPAPKAATKDTSREKIPATAARSGVGSLSSAS
jgi:hypothetical protein